MEVWPNAYIYSTSSSCITHTRISQLARVKLNVVSYNSVITEGKVDDVTWRDVMGMPKALIEWISLLLWIKFTETCFYLTEL
jgi:hypothetical protein